MPEQIQANDQWRRAWSQREENEEQIIFGCIDVVKRLPFTRVSDVCIFNCSDGPAVYGILQGLTQFTPSFDAVLTDIHPYAIDAAIQYIQYAQDTNLLSKAIYIRSQIQDTALILSDPPPQIRNFISYEPIAITTELLERAYDIIQAGTSITIIGRSPQGPVSQLGIAAKHTEAIMYSVSGPRTPAGNITAVMMVK